MTARSEAEKYGALVDEGVEVLAGRVLKLERQLDEAFEERDRTFARLVDDRNRLHDLLIAERKKTAGLVGVVLKVEPTSPDAPNEVVARFIDAQDRAAERVGAGVKSEAEIRAEAASDAESPEAAAIERAARRSRLLE